MHPLLLALLTLCLSPPALSIRTTIKNVTYAGKSCSRESAYTSISPDTTELIHGIDNFAPWYGLMTTPSDRKSNCTVLLDLAFDEPCTQLYVNQNGGDLLAYMPMPSNVSTTVVAQYEWMGSTMQAANRWEIIGPTPTGIYRGSDNANDNVIKGPCDGGTLKITYTAVVQERTKNGAQMPDPEEGMGRWTFRTSLQAAKCAMCNSVTV